MARVLRYCDWRSTRWLQQRGLREVDEVQSEGETAYATRQAAIQTQLARGFSTEWAHLPALIQQGRVAGVETEIIDDLDEGDTTDGTLMVPYARRRSAPSSATPLLPTDVLYCRPPFTVLQHGIAHPQYVPGLAAPPWLLHVGRTLLHSIYMLVPIVRKSAPSSAAPLLPRDVLHCRPPFTVLPHGTARPQYVPSHAAPPCLLHIGRTLFHGMYGLVPVPHRSARNGTFPEAPLRVSAYPTLSTPSPLVHHPVRTWQHAYSRTTRLYSLVPV
ncbi:hypothetical protein C8R45DRAFT_1110767, partial [Mycena sanguinolenta]